MKFKIKHEIRGRIRIHMEQKRMTHEQADILLFYLQNIDGVFRADVYDRTADATIHYKGNTGSPGWSVGDIRKSNERRVSGKTGE